MLHVIRIKPLTTLSVAYDDYGLLKRMFKPPRGAVPRNCTCLAAIIKTDPSAALAREERFAYIHKHPLRFSRISIESIDTAITIGDAPMTVTVFVRAANFGAGCPALVEVDNVYNGALHLDVPVA